MELYFILNLGNLIPAKFDLIKVIKGSQLKSITNVRSKDKYRKQRNLVVNLNKKEKKKFLNSLLIENCDKSFCETCKLMDLHEPINESDTTKTSIVLLKHLHAVIYKYKNYPSPYVIINFFSFQSDIPKEIFDNGRFCLR